ncbi:MAG TPA: hypothetical protein VIW29_21085 [Polyangiaceae bacterium]
MPESDARDIQPEAPATPRVSGEQQIGSGLPADRPLPLSSTRSVQAGPDSAVVSEPGDTLISAGKPAERWELVLEDRIGVIDARLQELEARLSGLERKRLREAPVARPKPWLWIVFLVAVAVVFQLLRWVR